MAWMILKEKSSDFLELLGLMTTEVHIKEIELFHPTLLLNAKTHIFLGKSLSRAAY